ncbi:MAG: hypothetical protein EOP54_11455 [Sphingobacteriales bacterium]|nr:MAG: hypothetical protein EOP54_11455 [Sphingobacteriales bacterium]
MKHLLKVVFTLIAAALFATASAQNGAFIKYDLAGKTITVTGDDLGSYNIFEAGDKDAKSNNEHSFYVKAMTNHVYKLNLIIHTPPHTNPVVGKLPYVAASYKPNSPMPAVYIGLTKAVEKSMDFYGSDKGSVGYFEITQVADGWVEGKFEIKIPKSFEKTKALHLTNGTFRFKIVEEG